MCLDLVRVVGVLSGDRALSGKLGPGVGGGCGDHFVAVEDAVHCVWIFFIRLLG